MRWPTELSWLSIGRFEETPFLLIRNEHNIEHEIWLLLSRLDSKLNHAYVAHT